MSKFINPNTGVVVSVDDSKDERFAAGWEPYTTTPSKAAARSGKKSE